ncbi:MAG: hypothetical protein M3Y72_23220, partial [Acidobacteriota bacterium]|nr:hypothetical protein [Acidobacteriota bacterium]
AENRHLDAALPRANLKNQPNPPCKASGKGNAFINACFFSTLLVQFQGQVEQQTTSAIKTASDRLTSVISP